MGRVAPEDFYGPPEPVHMPTACFCCWQVKDPDIGRDVVSLGFVKDLEIGNEETTGQRSVKFCLCLTTPACPFKGQIQQEAEAVVRKLPWVKQVSARFCKQPCSMLPLISCAWLSRLSPSLPLLFPSVALFPCLSLSVTLPISRFLGLSNAKPYTFVFR